MEKINEYGKIKISDNLFYRIIKNAIEPTAGRVTLSPERKNIILSEREDDITITFKVIFRFGSSILIYSNAILNRVEEAVKALNLGKHVHVKMNIVGIRSKRTAKRDIEVTRDIN